MSKIGPKPSNFCQQQRMVTLDIERAFQDFLKSKSEEAADKVRALHKEAVSIYIVTIADAKTQPIERQEAYSKYMIKMKVERVNKVIDTFQNLTKIKRHTGIAAFDAFQKKADAFFSNLNRIDAKLDDVFSKLDRADEVDRMEQESIDTAQTAHDEWAASFFSAQIKLAKLKADLAFAKSLISAD